LVHGGLSEIFGGGEKVHRCPTASAPWRSRTPRSSPNCPRASPRRMSPRASKISTRATRSRPTWSSSRSANQGRRQRDPVPPDRSGDV